MTFNELVTKLLDFYKLPSADYSGVAATSIQSAHLAAQRDHNFFLAQTLTDLVYVDSIDSPGLKVSPLPSGTKLVLSVEIKREPGVTPAEYGVTLDRIPYAKLIKDRRTQLGQGLTAPGVYDNNPDPKGDSELFPLSYFILEDDIGLYPVPSSSVHLTLHRIKWLPTPTEDDSDFLTEYGWDYLLFKAMTYLNMFLREDIRVPVNNEIMQQKWNSLLQWDISLANNNLQQSGNEPVKTS